MDNVGVGSHGRIAGFVDGVVYIDSVRGSPGTEWPLGDATDPVSNVADGVTIAVANKCHKLHIDGLHTISSSIAGYLIYGCTGPYAHTMLTLAGGVNNANATFLKSIVTGAANGLSYFENDCILYNLSGVDGFIRNTDLAGTITLASPTSPLDFTDFNRISTNSGSVTINCANLADGDDIRFHDFTGSIVFTNLVNNATIKIYLGSGANIILDNSCTGGVVVIHGVIGNFTDNSAGTTVTRYDIQGRTKGLDSIYDKVALMNSASGSATLNDANPSDTIVPTALPTKMNLAINISNLNNNGDDFDIEVEVGVSGSEQSVYWVNLTSDGINISADSGNGVPTVIKQRRIDIGNITVPAGEQVVITLTKNSGTDRDVPYKYVCGV